MVAKVNEVRKSEKRRPFGVPVSRLSVSVEIEGMHLRWINDEPGRIPHAQESGYAFVSPEEVGRVSREADERVRELVGTHRDQKTPMYAYLMKIPMEYYLEDRAVLNEQVDDIDDAIRKGRTDRPLGSDRYVPDGGISYKTK
jgi:hypothetical protein